MPLVIPVFIPHQGCPHCCIFCNQFRISGCANEANLASAADVGNIIRSWLEYSTEQRETQVAFYGGSFTGMDPVRQEELLGAVAPYLNRGQVQTIRLSTRPDYVDLETVSLLRQWNVGIVELGVQSLDDKVLEICQRGHTARQSVQAVRLLQENGFAVGIQLMLGLPGQTRGSLMKTVKKVAALKPDFVRIYPVLVLRESFLAALYTGGKYTPLTLDAAIVQAAWMKKYLDDCNIKIVRMGLQSGPELEANLLAGPYHPAFGEMVASRLMLQKTRKLLKNTRAGEQVILEINEKDQSVFRGNKSSNITKLRELGLLDRFALRTDENPVRHSVRLKNDLSSFGEIEHSTQNIKI